MIRHRIVGWLRAVLGAYVNRVITVEVTNCRSRHNENGVDRHFTSIVPFFLKRFIEPFAFAKLVSRS